jgi:hypothetical protein
VHAALHHPHHGAAILHHRFVQRDHTAPNEIAHFRGMFLERNDDRRVR